MSITKTIAIIALTRVFLYNGAELPDPGPQLTVEQVKEIFSAGYPELTNATVGEPVTKANKLVYSFERTAGAKG